MEKEKRWTRRKRTRQQLPVAAGLHELTACQHVGQTMTPTWRPRCCIQYRICCCYYYYFYYYYYLC
jgi:hypothetical protein